MILTLVLPAVAALIIGAVLTISHRSVPPRFAAPVLAAGAIISVCAVAAAAATVAVGFLAQDPWVGDRLGWCRSVLRTHGHIPAWLGLPATAVLVAMAIATSRVVRRQRRLRHPDTATRSELTVLPDERPQAYAIGGRHGQIVVSAGMLRLLSADERRVLLVHERSHLRHRHHCYLTVAAVTHAAVPFLRPLSRRLRLSIERWADEDAADEIGDRGLVARAILRAALAQQGGLRPGVLTLGGVGVGARIEALLDARRRPPGIDYAALAAGAAVLAVGVLSSTLQIHHFFAFAIHVCAL